jgi:hypothetical protein
MEGILIQTERATYSQNVLPEFASFEREFTAWNYVSGASNAIVETLRVGQLSYDGIGCTLMQINGTGECVFNTGGTQLEFSATDYCDYIFSWRLRKNLGTNDATFKVIIFINGVPNEVVCDLTANAGFQDGIWNTYYQRFSLTNSDPVDFNFSVQCDQIGETIYFDGFRVEADNRGVQIPTIYTAPHFAMTWNMRSDTVNTQNLTASTDNNFGFAGTLTQRDTNILLLSNTGVITPRKLLTSLTIDVSFDAVVPSGSNNWIEFKIMVGTDAYRQISLPFLRSTGSTQHFSQSFTLPVGDAFEGQTASVKLNPTANCTISKRFISVVENV